MKLTVAAAADEEKWAALIDSLANEADVIGAIREAKVPLPHKRVDEVLLSALMGRLLRLLYRSWTKRAWKC